MAHLTRFVSFEDKYNTKYVNKQQEEHVAIVYLMLMCTYMFF
jgi:hypothetical protein